MGFLSSPETLRQFLTLKHERFAGNEMEECLQPFVWMGVGGGGG